MFAETRARRGDFVGGVTADNGSADVVGETRAAADAEEERRDCGKAAVSSGEFGSSQNPTVQTGCLWKLRVNVRAGRREDPRSFASVASRLRSGGTSRG